MVQQDFKHFVVICIWNVPRRLRCWSSWHYWRWCKLQEVGRDERSGWLEHASGGGVLSPNLSVPLPFCSWLPQVSSAASTHAAHREVLPYHKPTVMCPGYMVQNLWKYEPKQSYCPLSCGLQDFDTKMEKWLINFRWTIWQKKFRNSSWKQKQKTWVKQRNDSEFFQKKINREIEIIKRREQGVAQW